LCWSYLSPEPLTLAYESRNLTLLVPSHLWLSQKKSPSGFSNFLIVHHLVAQEIASKSKENIWFDKL
jgi:hypothetical protein